MTTNQTIDGVPRELLGKLAKALMIFTGHDSVPNLRHNYGEEWWLPLDAMREELRAMLAKDSPCAKPQVDSSAPAQSKPVATVIAKTWLAGAPRAVALNAFGLELADGTQLYAEQPAPVAVVLPARPRADEEEYERMTDYEKGLLHGGIELWDKIDEAIRLAAKSR